MWVTHVKRQLHVYRYMGERIRHIDDISMVCSRVTPYYVIMMTPPCSIHAETCMVGTGGGRYTTTVDEHMHYTTQLCTAHVALDPMYVVYLGDEKPVHIILRRWETTISKDLGAVNL